MSPFAALAALAFALVLPSTAQPSSTLFDEAGDTRPQADCLSHVQIEAPTDAEWRQGAALEADLAADLSRHLAGRHDPRSLLVAALYAARAQSHQAIASGATDHLHSDPGPGAPSAEIARRALAVADQPQILYWLLVQPDLGLDSASRRQALQRLRLLDPDNLLPLLLSTDDGEAAALGQRLQRLPDGLQRAEMYYDAVGPLVFEVLRTIEIDPALAGLLQQQAAGDEHPPQDPRALAALNLSLSAPMPPLQGLSTRCDPRAIDWTEALRPGCLQAARLLAERSDTLLLQAVGLSIWHRLVAGYEAEAEVVALHRNHAWQREAWIRLQQLDADQVELAAAIAQLERPTGNELQRIADALQAAGVPLQAPEQWRPSRSLAGD
jgi:hypothetical protein